MLPKNCIGQFGVKQESPGRKGGFQCDWGSSVTFPPRYHGLDKQLNQQALLQAGSQHNAETTRDQRFTSVSINSELGELCLHHLRQMPHGINTGALADRQMSQSHNLR